MAADGTHRHPELSQGALLQRAVEDERVASEFWELAIQLRERGLIELAEKFRSASRSARVAAIQCRARAGRFSVLS
jgi:hypothetical protein